MTLKEFRLPDAGEGLADAEIVSWKVQPGDVVAINDVIVEIETAKSLVELPCPFAGVVHELLVAEGSTVPVGTPIIAVRTEGDGEPPADGAAPSRSGEAVDVSEATEVVAPRRTPVLVGYGPLAGATARRRRRPVEPEPKAATADSARPLAKPPVRKLAKDLGIDLAEVAPSGAEGVITRADVEAVSAGALAVRPAAPTPPGVRETREPVKGVRRMTAEAMVASAFTAPHVTEWVQADVTRTMKLLQRLRREPRFDGAKLSPLTLVAKALLVAVARHPGVNVAFDSTTGEAGEIVAKHYVNLGIAAATPRGLVVPVIRDADRMGLHELAEAIATLAETARAGRTPPADMTGGTITITNVGVFGVDGGTPIINPGQAAILAVGQIAPRPWVHKGKVRPRWVTTLALSFDHRVVDGDLGSRVLADVAAVLTDPATALA